MPAHWHGSNRGQYDDGRWSDSKYRWDLELESLGYDFHIVFGSGGRERLLAVGIRCELSGIYYLATMDIRLDRSGTGPDDFEIQASVNGGTAVSLLTHDFNDSANEVEFTNVDLSAIGALTQGDSVVFTLVPLFRKLRWHV